MADAEEDRVSVGEPVFPGSESQFDSQLPLDYTPAEEHVAYDSNVTLLKQAWQNEKCAPDILHYASDLIPMIVEQIRAQEDQIALHQQQQEMEVNRVMGQYALTRVKCLLRWYQRTRLQKIEKHVMWILDEPEVHTRLSPQELAYAKQQFLNFGRHQKENVLNRLPDGYQDLTKQSLMGGERDMMDKPDLDTHVFCLVLSDRGTVELTDDGLETAEFREGDLYVVRHKPIQDLIKDRWVRLI